MKNKHIWCPDPTIADDAFWTDVLPGFGQETYFFAVYLKLDKETNTYKVRAHSQPCGFFEEDEVVPDAIDELRINLPDCCWDGLARIVPSGDAVTKVLKANAVLLQQILAGNDIEEDSLTEEAFEAIQALEQLLSDASEEDDFWHVEEVVLKPE